MLEWIGRTGIGVKRKLSASSLDRMAKMSKLANDASNDQFRDRSRQVYEERRAEGRLGMDPLLMQPVALSTTGI